jgi:hypothetical protein
MLTISQLAGMLGENRRELWDKQSRSSNGNAMI